ncbi:IS3 family transposase [Dialister invisus]
MYCKTYKDSKDAYQSIFEYIESGYNHRRKHSSLGYQTLDEVHAGRVA